MTWWQQLRTHLHPAGKVPWETRLADMVTVVLHDQRFFGEVLLQLPRQANVGLTGAFGLSWSGHQLVLQVNPSRLAKLRDDEAQLLLEHEALHVLWRHPARYASYPHPDLARLATDMAVNQYLPSAPTGTATLGELERVLRQRLPEKQDSQEYLAILESASPAEQERLRKSGYQLTGGQRGRKARVGYHRQHSEESHAGWRKSAADNASPDQNAQLAAISRLLAQAWSKTPQRDRGLLPGDIHQALNDSVDQPRTALWAILLQRQIGSLVVGRRDSNNRFNRRQPLRMDLPGQVGRIVPDLHIFVDNSGSVPDSEINRALAAVDQLAGNYYLVADVYTFDARVNPGRQRLRTGTHLRRERHGGGGTSFQSIFDFLQAHHISRRSVIVIITDGWGEKTIRDHHYQNTYWLLTTKRDQLSVPTRHSHVFELRGD